jgi:hypothetical protein
MPRSRRTTILLVLHWLIAASLILAYLGLALAGTRVDASRICASGLAPLSPGFIFGYDVFEHGWPLPCLTREVNNPLDSSRWAVWRGTRTWNVRGLIVDALCFVIAVGGIMALATWKARKGRPCVLNLKECLGITLCIAIVAAHFAACMRRSAEARRFESEVEHVGGHVRYEYGGPCWLVRVHGDIYEDDPFGIDLNVLDLLDLSYVKDNNAEEFSRLLARCPRLDYVRIDGVDWEDESIVRVLIALQHCKPEGLTIEHVPLSDAAIAEIAKFPRLRMLDLAYTSIGDEQLRLLRDCRSLELLDVTRTEVSAAGVRDALAFPRLQRVIVSNALLVEHGDLDEFATSQGKTVIEGDLFLRF